MGPQSVFCGNAHATTANHVSSLFRVFGLGPGAPGEACISWAITHITILFSTTECRIKPDQKFEINREPHCALDLVPHPVVLLGIRTAVMLASLFAQQPCCSGSSRCTLQQLSVHLRPHAQRLGRRARLQVVAVGWVRVQALLHCLPAVRSSTFKPDTASSERVHTIAHEAVPAKRHYVRKLYWLDGRRLSACLFTTRIARITSVHCVQHVERIKQAQVLYLTSSFALTP